MSLSDQFFGLIGRMVKLEERLRDLWEEAVERGELRRTDSRDYLYAVLERIKGEKAELDKVFLDIMEDVADSVGLANAKDVREIETSLSQIENKLKCLK